MLLLVMADAWNEEKQFSGPYLLLRLSLCIIKPIIRRLDNEQSCCCQICVYMFGFLGVSMVIIAVLIIYTRSGKKFGVNVFFVFVLAYCSNLRV